MIDDWDTSEIALRWFSPKLTDKSTLVRVMAWCRQATSHYPDQCWPIPYGVTRPQWINMSYNMIQSPMRHYVLISSCKLVCFDIICNDALNASSLVRHLTSSSLASAIIIFFFFGSKNCLIQVWWGRLFKYVSELVRSRRLVICLTDFINWASYFKQWVLYLPFFLFAVFGSTELTHWGNALNTMAPLRYAPRGKQIITNSKQTLSLFWFVFWKPEKFAPWI